MNIALIGTRGAGKSKISRRLSYILKLPNFQLDELIVYEAGGISIPEIVEKHGWYYFRELEYKTLEKLSKLDNIIIDAGGGIVVDLDEAGNEIYSERKVSLLKKTSFVIWLKADVEKTISKIQGDSNRPDLSKREGYLELMEKRMPFYRDACNVEFSMEGHNKKSAGKEIIDILLKEKIIGPLDDEDKDS